MHLEWIQKTVGPTSVWSSNLGGMPLTGSAIFELLVDAWHDVATLLFGPYQHRKWDIIRVELLEETGQLRIYPFSYEAQELAPAGCELRSDWLFEFIQARIRPEDQPMADEQIEKVVHDVAEVLVLAAKKAAFATVFGRNLVKIEVCFSGDDEPLFFGDVS